MREREREREREPPTHTGMEFLLKNLKKSKMGTMLNTFQNCNNNNKIFSFSFSPPQTLEGLAMDLRMWVLWS
jgi:hypothetical protein